MTLYFSFFNFVYLRLLAPLCHPSRNVDRSLSPRKGYSFSLFSFSNFYISRLWPPCPGVGQPPSQEAGFGGRGPPGHRITHENAGRPASVGLATPAGPGTHHSFFIIFIFFILAKVVFPDHTPGECSGVSRVPFIFHYFHFFHFLHFLIFFIFAKVRFGP